MFADFSISKLDEIMPTLAQKQTMIEDLADTILKREKGEYLSFQQKHDIYICVRKQG